jgi:hypothetical protein
LGSFFKVRILLCLTFLKGLEIAETIEENLGKWKSKNFLIPIPATKQAFNFKIWPFSRLQPTTIGYKCFFTDSSDPHPPTLDHQFSSGENVKQIFHI